MRVAAFIAVWLLILGVMAAFIFWTVVMGIIGLAVLTLGVTGGMAWSLTHLEDE